MILHFSHIGLTDGRTFTLVRSHQVISRMFLAASALATGTVAATAPRSATQRERMRRKRNA
jgi:hypothetical protein